MTQDDTPRLDSTPPPTAAQGPDPVRRRLTKLGLATPPVIVSLTARPVWGDPAMCLSEILSGNLSQPRESCVTGHCPSYWRDNPDWPVGVRGTPPEPVAAPVQTTSEPVSEEPAAPTDPSLEPQTEPAPGESAPLTPQGEPTQCELDWNVGTPAPSTFQDLFGVPDAVTPSRTALQILTCDGCSTQALLIAAYFNALTIPDYVVKAEHVQQLAAGAAPPGSATLEGFLAYTMPGCCEATPPP